MPQTVDSTGRIREAQELPTKLVDVYAARPSATGLPNGTLFFALDKYMEWVAYGGAWTLVNVYAPEVTSLPSSPIDQQECVYVADATNGVKWHLRYRSASASAYKWELIGGSDLVASVATQESTTNSAYVDLTTLGPQIVVPLAGDYICSYGAMAYASTAANIIRTALRNKSTATTLEEIIWRLNNQMTHMRRGKASGVLASQTVALQYASDTGDTANFASRFLHMRPVRVG